MANEKAAEDIGQKTAEAQSVEESIAQHDPESYRERHDELRLGVDQRLVEVKVRNISVTLDPATLSPFSTAEIFKARFLRGAKPPVKHILKDVSADFPARSLTAIIGASGSGKTTLLNIVSDRVKDKAFQRSGTVSYDPVDHGSHESIGMAYVLQQDVLLPTLTVRETLQYAADLRLSANSSKAERQIMVENVIADLGLQNCADTRIGDDAHKGCSGGEKRRTSIGVQLLADQPILILDEPTTGLDAASAIQVVRTLKALATRGKTVVMTSKFILPSGFDIY